MSDARAARARGNARGARLGVQCEEGACGPSLALPPAVGDSPRSPVGWPIQLGRRGLAGRGGPSRAGVTATGLASVGWLGLAPAGRVALLALLVVLAGAIWLVGASAPMGTPRRLAFACDASGCASVAAPPAAVAGGGLFRSETIDLTGDGVPDDVRLEGGRIAVAASDGSAWQSQVEWDVVDVALGDPNDDGRGEMMVAFWKRDAAGVRRSQPFVVGYRGGLYRPLWGGSPVEDPIDELELADVDGDGAQDLVVLDAGGPDGQLTVSVWRWHGWGFTRMWRSEPGKYHDLAVVPGGAAGAAIVMVMVDPPKAVP